MSKRSAILLIQDMLEAIEKIRRYTAGLTTETFLADEKSVDAVVRNLEIIGEAVPSICLLCLLSLQLNLDMSKFVAPAFNF